MRSGMIYVRGAASESRYCESSLDPCDGLYPCPDAVPSSCLAEDMKRGVRRQWTERGWQIRNSSVQLDRCQVLQGGPELCVAVTLALAAAVAVVVLIPFSFGLSHGTRANDVRGCHVVAVHAVPSSSQNNSNPTTVPRRSHRKLSSVKVDVPLYPSPSFDAPDAQKWLCSSRAVQLSSPVPCSQRCFISTHLESRGVSLLGILR